MTTMGVVTSIIAWFREFIHQNSTIFALTKQEKGGKIYV